MTPHDISNAERELMLALNPGPESDADVRQADWAQWWGPRLIAALRFSHKDRAEHQQEAQATR